MVLASIIQTITGSVWFIVGILIIVWLIFPSELFLFVLWCLFAIGCILTGLIMLFEPYLKK